MFLKYGRNVPDYEKIHKNMQAQEDLRMTDSLLHMLPNYIYQVYILFH